MIFTELNLISRLKLVAISFSHFKRNLFRFTTTFVFHVGFICDKKKRRPYLYFHYVINQNVLESLSVPENPFILKLNKNPHTFNNSLSLFISCTTINTFFISCFLYILSAELYGICPVIMTSTFTLNVDIINTMDFLFSPFSF